MSREWYIRTDRRQPAPVDDAPLTRHAWWKRYGRRYLLWSIEALLLAAVVVFTLTQVFRKTPHDYTLLLVTMQPMCEEDEQKLLTALQHHGEDRDGDGKVTVALRAVAVGGDDQNNSAREAVIQYLIHGDPPFVVMESAAYARYIAPYIADGTSLFAPLPDPAHGTLTAGNTLWQDGNLLYGVRLLPDAGDALAAEQTAHISLLNRYISQK